MTASVGETIYARSTSVTPGRAATLRLYFGGGNALESDPLHRTMVGVHRHDSHGGDVLGRHAERDQGRVGQANVEAVASGARADPPGLQRGVCGDLRGFRTEQPVFRPGAIETASRLLGALVVVAVVYSYAFLRGWPRWTVPP